MAKEGAAGGAQPVEPVDAPLRYDEVKAYQQAFRENQSSINSYVSAVPELQTMVSHFVSAVLRDKPADIPAFAVEFFSRYRPTEDGKAVTVPPASEE